MLQRRRAMHIVHARRLKSSQLSQFHLIKPSPMKASTALTLHSSVRPSLKAFRQNIPPLPRQKQGKLNDFLRARNELCMVID